MSNLLNSQHQPPSKELNLLGAWTFQIVLKKGISGKEHYENEDFKKEPQEKFLVESKLQNSSSNILLTLNNINSFL